VDKDAKFILFLKAVLEQNGYEVVTASDGLQALNLLKKHIPDIIISEILMPNMNGYEFFLMVSNDPRFSHIPFIFLTDLSSPANVSWGKALGADDYLVKSEPFKNEDILATIAGKLARIQKRGLINKKVEKIFPYINLDRSAPVSLKDKTNIILLFEIWDEKLGPSLKRYFPRNIDLPVSLENIGFQLFQSVISIYGQGDIQDAQGLLLSIENVGLECYVFFDSRTDVKVIGRSYPFMLSVLAPKINYLESLQIKEIFQEISPKIKTKKGMEWNIEDTWDKIANLLVTPPLFTKS
jgi:CheY-like chemotaxis protein